MKEKILADLLQKELEISEQLWKDGERSHAYIVGYLQGAIKGTITELNIMSSYEYRQFLINNGAKIMEINNKYTLEKAGNGSCNAIPVPFETECIINKTISNCGVIDNNGIGLYNKGVFNN